jgi:tRNA(Ile)-lysidine synthase
MIAHVGNEGAAELGQLETLYAELTAAAGPPGAAPRRLRRTLVGALVTLSESKLTVERAPPRRSAQKTGTSGRKGTFTKARQDDVK